MTVHAGPPNFGITRHAVNIRGGIHGFKSARRSLLPRIGTLPLDEFVNGSPVALRARRSGSTAEMRSYYGQSLYIMAISPQASCNCVLLLLRHTS